MSDREPSGIDRIPLQDAAGCSGFTVHILRRHIHGGTLPASKNGNRYEVAIADLDALPARLEQIRQDREKAFQADLAAADQKIVKDCPPLSEDRKRRLRALPGGGERR